jgi:short-chain Z-isoprenyl diphosphate synthase
VGARALLYRLYERRLAADLRRRGGLPRHVGVIIDGNRRWARQLGMDTVAGHRRGADQIDHLLGWAQELGIPVVTLWLLSTENLLRRHPDELAELLAIIETKVLQLARDAGPDGYRIVPVGELDELPERTRARLREAEAVSRGHREYAEKGLELVDAAGRLTPDEIARHLYTAGMPDPDLIIRTSGEIRLSGFLLWQSAHSEYYFADAYWPAFRKVDFLRALRSYAQRSRRFGR